MKIRYFGFAIAVLATFAFSTAASAQPVRAFDVCVDPALNTRLDDVDGSTDISAGDGIVAVGNIYPAGTIPTDGTGAPTDCSGLGPAIGTFLTQGRFLRSLPPGDDRIPTTPDDMLVYVIWHFRVPGVGAIDTTGPVLLAPEYPQTITGATGRFKRFRAGGVALTQVLDPLGFQFRLHMNGKIN